MILPATHMGRSHAAAARGDCALAAVSSNLILIRRRRGRCREVGGDEAASVQVEREAEPDDAAADDGNLHPSSPSGCAAIVNARFDEDKPDGITSGGLTIRNKPCTMAHPVRIVSLPPAYRPCTGSALCRAANSRCYLAVPSAVISLLTPLLFRCYSPGPNRKTRDNSEA